MIAPLIALSLTASQPPFTVPELASLRCGWVLSPTHRIRGDYQSHAQISGRRLTVDVAGAEVPRTIFIVIDGLEQRITASGPVRVERLVQNNKRHKVILGTLYKEVVLYGVAVCL